MSKKKVILVAGARPNFMKIAPVLRAFNNFPEITPILVHTGQHYDNSMSASFFKDLDIREPDYNLAVGSGTHAFQTANIMIKFEEVCLKEKPDIVMVVGDVNSTIAAGLVAKKCNCVLAHIEAGLRSGDRGMPEEINRLATDAITDLFFTTEKSANENLKNEGIPESKIHFVGHVMIDNLLFQLNKIKADSSGISQSVLSLRKKLPGKYACLTMHRPSNVDNKETLGRLLEGIRALADKVPVIFPCHPRTRKQIDLFGFKGFFKEIPDTISALEHGIYFTEPFGYNDFLYIWKDAHFVLTDSGGLQEETTALRIPCITLRETTERPITAELGSNEVAGTSTDMIIALGTRAIEGSWKKCEIPPLWDGHAAERIAGVVEN